MQLSSSIVDCATLSGDEATLDAYAAGASELQNLGDGYYQWNWATQRGWAGSCRQLRLSLEDAEPSGVMVNRVADFEFK